MKFLNLKVLFAFCVLLLAFVFISCKLQSVYISPLSFVENSKSYYIISGVLFQNIGGKFIRDDTLTINEEKIQTDSLGRFWYRSYFMNVDWYFAPKILVVKYKKSEFQIKNNWSKYYWKPIRRNEIPIMYVAVYCNNKKIEKITIK